MLSREANIQESVSINDIKDLIEEDSWLLVDLDNTLEETTGILGSDQWFGKISEYACKVIPDTKEAIAYVLAIYNEVQHHVKVRAVEKDTVNLISHYQKHNRVIGITARGEIIKDDTIKQLKEIGIDFKGDIIFCNGKDKGLCLAPALEKEENLPPHIVMVDDKEKHLIHVRDIVTKRGIRFNGLRYGYLDEKVKMLDMNEAQVELDQIKHEFTQSAQSAIDKLKLNDALLMNSMFKPKCEEIPGNNASLSHFSFNKKASKKPL